MLALVLVSSSQKCFSQFRPPQPKFYNYTVEDGLPGSETYFVHQDKKGYIWICTDRGVSRFDGYKFENFTTANGMTDNVVFKIFEDYKGRIWFVTYNSQLCYYEDGRIFPYKYNNKIGDIQAIITNSSLKTLSVDEKDNVYISIALNGLWIVDKNGNVQKRENRKGIWVGKYGPNLMWSYVRQTQGVDTSQFYFYNDGKTIRKQRGNYHNHSRISLTISDKQDYLLLDTNLYELKTGRRISSVNDAVDIYSIGKMLWVGTLKNGAVCIPDLSKPWRKAHYLNGLSISSVMQDNEGGWWFSSLEKGVFYSPCLSIRSYTTQQGLLDDEIVSLAGIKDNIYIGFLLGRWQNLKYPEYQKTTKHPYNSIFGCSDNKFYLSNVASYPIVNGKQGDVIYNSWVNDYYSKGNSVIFGLQTVHRLYDNGFDEILYNHNKDHSKEGNNIFRAVMLDMNNVVWGGTLSGLIYIKDNHMSREGLDDPLFKVRVSDLASHPKWKNIAATRGAGIYFFDKTKILSRITTLNGLLSDLVNVLFIDKQGGIWVGTNKGLNHITKNSKGKLNITSFTVFHGLCSNEISSVYVYNDMVYVGTKGGLSVIDIKAFRRNKQIAKVYVNSFETGNKRLDPNMMHTLSHKESYIKLTLGNSNYRLLGTGSYQYRFNKSSEWITTDVSEITLINPLPGDYDLEIRYKNEDGVMSYSYSACKFTIEEAFYNRWYFFVALAIFIALIAWWIFRFRIRQLKQRHLINNKINQLEQKALQAQMNPHFIFNALNSIQSFLVYEENDKAEKYLLKFAQLIRQTLNNSREPYITVESEIEILEKYLDLERMRFKNKFKYKIINNLLSSDLSLRIPNMLIQPFVENAVIHGFSTLDSGGEITVTLESVDGTQILCTIEDNGIGRKRAMQQSSKTHVSFGTTITEERLKAFETKHGMRFRIETIDIELGDGNTGTKVMINLPVI